MACNYANFLRSDVVCSKPDQATCASTTFFASKVKCEDGWGTCGEGGLRYTGAFFDPCSCCDGPDCPVGTPRCVGSTITTFCSSKLLGKTCKEWGNPACDGIAVTEPSPPLHPSSSCSLQEEIAICNSDRHCNRLQVDNCSVYCQERTCEATEFFDSTVECIQDLSCKRAIFHRSEVLCSELGYSVCGGNSKFIASKVICEDGWETCGSYGTKASFDPCSCCNGPRCPDGVPRCSGSGLHDFCSSTYLGKTCKDWGNPACNA